MTESRRPSYFPPRVSSIPTSLQYEEKYWSMDPELVLSEDSANEMLRSHNLMEELFRSDVLERLGLKQELSGVNCLRAHGTRVAILSLWINQERKKRKSKLAANSRILATAALLHDVGKLDPKIHQIVMYPGIIEPNDNEAWDLIKKHPNVSHHVVQAMWEFTRDERLRVAEAVFKHHERKDGKGYYHIPFANIPSESQVISVADTIDVMSGKRPYRKPCSTDQIVAELIRCKDQFNSEIACIPKEIVPVSGHIIHYAA